jgi:tripartite-type tricarboxylate transporter receptor subunit TctC
MNFATSGPSTILDLGIRHLFASASLPLDAAVALPFRGGGEALTALLGGQAQFLGNNLADMAGALAGGTVRALAVSTRERFPTIPEVPTAREAGFPALEQIVGWNALFGPPGLPDGVVATWTRVLGALARDEEWLTATRRLGSVPRILPAAATRDYVRAQVELYRDLGRRLGLV